MNTVKAQDAGIVAERRIDAQRGTRWSMNVQTYERQRAEFEADELPEFRAELEQLRKDRAR